MSTAHTGPFLWQYALARFGTLCYTGTEVNAMEINIWKALLIMEIGAALISFILGFAWAAALYTSRDLYAGIAILSGVGFLNAALLTVIADKLSSKDGGDNKKA